MTLMWWGLLPGAHSNGDVDFVHLGPPPLPPPPALLPLLSSSPIPFLKIAIEETTKHRINTIERDLFKAQNPEP